MTFGLMIVERASALRAVSYFATPSSRRGTSRTSRKRGATTACAQRPVMSNDRATCPDGIRSTRSSAVRNQTSLPPPIYRLARSTVTTPPHMTTSPAPRSASPSGSQMPIAVAMSPETTIPVHTKAIRCHAARPGFNGTQSQCGHAGQAPAYSAPHLGHRVVGIGERALRSNRENTRALAA